ncbi:MAG: sugar phosphate isomerase/epimerase [Microbacteriaceae bacterium]|nr:sugar phosphate isomerase/epimerase [Microbacteriaceae bacterium]
MYTDHPLWTLSGFGDEIDPDPRVQIAVLKAVGARHIEVRSAWNANISELSSHQLSELATLLKQEVMGVSALASPIGKVDVDADPEEEIARLKTVITAAQTLETRYIRIFSFFRGDGVRVEDTRDTVLRRLRNLASIAERENVILLHENEKNIYGDTPERVADLVESVGSPALRLAWDSANFVQVGVAHPHDEGYALLRPYIDYLQVKDALLATGEVVPAGQGDGQVADTVAALAADGYSGFASLEPHLASAHELGGFSGPTAFGDAARAFALILDENGISTQ